MDATDDRVREAFEALRSRPGREALEALLRGIQHSVYNVCFQVLRHPQDAEDAAQAALVAAVDRAGRMPSYLDFRRWLVRVAVNAALKVQRARNRRLARESQVPPMPGSSPSDPELAARLAAALAALDDESRWLIAEHYFEKATVEQLGRRSGVTGAAVWKRIERARERLKKSLAGAGLAAPAVRLDGLLDSAVPVRAPAHLLSGAVAARVAEGMTIGGALMVKKLLAASVGIAALACVSAVLARRATTAVQDPSSGAGTRTASAVGTSGTTSSTRTTSSSLQTTQTVRVGGGGPAVPEPPAASRPAGSGPLAKRLDRYLAWARPFAKELSELCSGKHAPEQWTSWYERRDAGMAAEVEGLRELVLQDPAAFVAFLRELGDALPFPHELIGTVLGRRAVFENGRLAYDLDKTQDAADLPAEVLAGFEELARTGPGNLRTAILDFAAELRNLPPGFRRACVDSLSDADAGVQQFALHAVAGFGASLDSGSVERIAGLAGSGGNPNLRSAAVRALAGLKTPASDRLLMELLDRGSDPAVEVALLQEVAGRFHTDAAGWSDGAIEGRYASALAAALGKALRVEGVPDLNLQAHLKCLVASAAWMSLPRMTEILDAVLGSAVPENLKGPSRRALEAIRQGETDPNKLRRILAGL